MAGALARKYLYEPWPREFSMYSTVRGNKFATSSLSRIYTRFFFFLSCSIDRFFFFFYDFSKLFLYARSRIVALNMRNFIVQDVLEIIFRYIN